MGPIEIPVASPIGKLVVMASCVLIVWAVLWWWWPKFKIFLNTLSGRTPRKPETKNIHMILGFIVYAIILAPAAIATFIGVGIATTAPTLISSTGVMGTTSACEGLSSVVIFTCRTPFSLGNRRKTITWNEIDRVECTSRDDGTISALYIHSGTRQIEIGSFAIRDLRGAHDVILAHAPRSAARPLSGCVWSTESRSTLTKQGLATGGWAASRQSERHRRDQARDSK